MTMFSGSAMEVDSPVTHNGSNSDGKPNALVLYEGSCDQAVFLRIAF